MIGLEGSEKGRILEKTPQIERGDKVFGVDYSWFYMVNPIS
jgi:hypothetical protein